MSAKRMIMWLMRVRKLYLISTVITVFTIAVLSFGIWQNVSAQHDLTRATLLDKQGSYQPAATLLQHIASPVLWPALRADVQAELRSNLKWSEYLSRQHDAEKRLAAGDNNGALVILKAITSDYPGYAAVTHDIAQAQAAIAAAEAQAAAKAAAEAAQKAAAEAAKKVAQTHVSLSAPTYPSCVPSTGLKGRRLTSTAAYSTVLNANSVAQVQQALQSFFDQYGVHVELTTVSPSSSASQVVAYELATSSDLCSLKVYGATMIDEWSKYPADWIHATKLKDMILVKTLRVSGQVRAAMPDAGGWDMYYDVTYSGDYAREVIHHEFDHLLTASYFGGYWPSDPTWQSLNPSNFTYGNGGTSCYTSPGSCPYTLHPILGFVDFYATTDIAEDKAELYGYLMTDSYYHNLKTWMATDVNLVNKVNNYKQFIASHAPEMSGSYFDDINP